ncbi:enoyl-CoA hydratase/isomerase family protein [Jatrophihabitans sp. DSM 45814]
MRTFSSLQVIREGQVATIKLRRLEELLEVRPQPDIHWDLGAALTDLREDHGIRVIVICGAIDGEFLVTPQAKNFPREGASYRLADPKGAWTMMMGNVRTNRLMAEIEKPIVAKVNGDAIGFGQSIAFGSDFILARADAKFNDMHLGQGEVTSSAGTPIGPPFGMVPGDGAGALVPLFMSPVKAKEYLMLSTDMTGEQLAAMHCINAAVSAELLDDAVDDLVQRLLSKSAYALAWTKQIINRRVVDQLNGSLELSVAYETINFLQIERLGFRDPLSLD